MFTDCLLSNGAVSSMWYKKTALWAQDKHPVLKCYTVVHLDTAAAFSYIDSTAESTLERWLTPATHICSFSLTHTYATGLQECSVIVIYCVWCFPVFARKMYFVGRKGNFCSMLISDRLNLLAEDLGPIKPSYRLTCLPSEAAGGHPV